MDNVFYALNKKWIGQIGYDLYRSAYHDQQQKKIILNQENFDNSYPYNWCQWIFPLFLHPQWHLAKILKYVWLAAVIQEKSVFLQKAILSNNYMFFRYEKQIQILNHFVCKLYTYFALLHLYGLPDFLVSKNLLTSCKRFPKDM